MFKCNQLFHDKAIFKSNLIFKDSAFTGLFDGFLRQSCSPEVGMKNHILFVHSRVKVYFVIEVKTGKNMRTISGKILQWLGWKVTGGYGDLKKSVTVFAPHTAHVDALYGRLGFNEIRARVTFLTRKDVFVFPFNLILRKFGSIPVRGVKGVNAIYQVAKMLEEAEEMHIVISPEGRIYRRTQWNKGFYYMAKKANVPIVVATLDYAKKEMGIKKVIHDTSDFNAVIREMNEVYRDVRGKHPERFALHEIGE
jgi:1-acyl-sn-glycerol-3-phosphate acyltransferase